MEYDRDGDVHIVDSDMATIMDAVTGELQRFGRYKCAVGTFEDAKESCFWWFLRHVIIEQACVRAYQMAKIGWKK